MPNMMSNLPLKTIGWTLTVLAVATFLYATFIGDASLRLLTKPWPVILLAIAVHRGSTDPYGQSIRNGLLASALGDICLEFDSGFLPGMGAFLVAHLFYLRAYLNADRTPRWARALPFVIWGIAVVYGLRSGLLAAGMLIPVAIYTAAICAMLWRAAARLRSGVGADVWLAAGGALAFALSDTLIAITQFGPEIEGSPYWIIGLYWLGQWGIASSTRRADSRRSEI